MISQGSRNFPGQSYVSPVKTGNSVPKGSNWNSPFRPEASWGKGCFSCFDREYSEARARSPCHSGTPLLQSQGSLSPVRPVMSRSRGPVSPSDWSRFPCVTPREAQQVTTWGHCSAVSTAKKHLLIRRLGGGALCGWWGGTQVGSMVCGGVGGALVALQPRGS